MIILTPVYCKPDILSYFIVPLSVHLLPYLYIKGGEVAIEVLRVIDVRLPTDWTHHVPYVFIPHSNCEVLLKAATAH